MLAKSTPGMLIAAEAVRDSRAATYRACSVGDDVSALIAGSLLKRRTRRPTSVAGHLADGDTSVVVRDAAM